MGIRNINRVRKRMIAIASDLPGQLVQSMSIAMLAEGTDGVVGITPVDTARLRGGWDASINQPSPFVPPESGSYPSPEDVVRKALEVFAAAPPFARYVLTNNVDYADVWERGTFQPPNPGPTKNPKKLGQVLVRDGFNTAAPHGMLRIGALRMLAVARSFRFEARRRGLG